MLHAHFQENLDADAGQAVWKRIDAHNFREIFAIDGGGIVGIRHGNEEAKPDLVTRLAGLKVYAAARNAHGAAQVLEMLAFGV